MLKPEDSGEPARNPRQRPADESHRDRNLSKLEQLGEEEYVVDRPGRLASYAVEFALGTERYVDDVSGVAVTLGIASVRLAEGPKAEAEPDVDVFVDAEEAQYLPREDLQEGIGTVHDMEVARAGYPKYFLFFCKVFF